MGNCHTQRHIRTRPDTVITGYASYYAHKFHGRMTANGEIYDMHGITAAHRTLPFNTMVKVKNLNNNKSVIVRINDRGPFIKGRHIDLSLGAAEKIDMVIDGIVPVRMEILSDIEHIPSKSKYVIQVGSFRDRERAYEHRNWIRSMGYNAFIERYGEFYRVRVGVYENVDEARRKEKDLNRLGIETFIARSD